MPQAWTDSLPRRPRLAQDKEEVSYPLFADNKLLFG